VLEARQIGQNLKHLITLLDELQSLGIPFVSLAEGIDATTPAGKLQMHILGAIAEFERGRIRERVVAGLRRARAEGRRWAARCQSSPRTPSDGGCAVADRCRGRARCIALNPQALEAGQKSLSPAA
jgi:DNA invertase Pin-like site-specific DNA recombinase